ncbi:MAG TPA: DUF1697 domain-containing protein [Candidatus Sulfotelmatobacter sp.]|jgi:uncharacterized protein (DUF1697 family)
MTFQKSIGYDGTVLVERKSLNAKCELPIAECELPNPMPVVISMLRGINVGGHNKIKMDALRALYESVKCEGPRTYVQSGNVIFRTKEKHSSALAKKIQNAIEKKFGCCPDVVLRTTEEMRRAIAANPFGGRDLEPGKILVTFLAAEPGPEAQSMLLVFKKYPEELHLKGRELYIYFPNGAGKSKLPWSTIGKLLKTTGTARNWNSVTKMLAIAEEMEAAD